jgi:hypothetical protein
MHSLGGVGDKASCCAKPEHSNTTLTHDCVLNDMKGVQQNARTPEFFWLQSAHVLVSALHDDQNACRMKLKHNDDLC